MPNDDIQLVAGPELRRVANALRKLDRTLTTQFRKDLKLATKPMVAEAKKNAKSIPVGRPSPNKLRRSIARGVVAQSSTGRLPRVRIVVKMADESRAIIPRGLDSPPKGFRHPVFGKSEQWVVQKPHTSKRWFMDAMQGGRNDAINAINRTLADARDYIASQGEQGP